MDFPTDLEYLVSLGYTSQAAKKALKASAGDRAGAIAILSKGGVAEKSDTAWRQELAGDWQTGVAKDLPKSAESRGLWKSPIYARVPSFRRNDNDEIEYQINVVLKDGRKWRVDRTYKHFLDLKLALPLSTAMAFSNWFPQTTFFSSLTSASVEQRRQQLEDWFHELLMNEDVMSNNQILERIYSFIKAHEHGGSGYITPAQQAQRVAEMQENLGLMSVTGASAETREQATMKAIGSTALPKSLLDLKMQDPTVLPALPAQLDPALRQALPISMNDMLRNLPFAVPTKDLTQLQAMLTEIAKKPAGKDRSIAQLEHDYQRDRAIIQGRRLEGHLLSIDFLIEGCKEIISSLLKSRGQTAEDPDLVDTLAKRSLQQLSRTESAFISFTAISEVVSVADGTFIVPESSLAEPVVVNYRIMDKPASGNKAAAPVSSTVSPVPRPAATANTSGASSGNKSGVPGTPSPTPPTTYAPGELLPWCIVCEGLANTVYRICEGDSLKTKIQLKVTYRKTFYIMVNQSGGAGKSSSSSAATGANGSIAPPPPPDGNDVSDEDISDNAIMELLQPKVTRVKSSTVDLTYKDGPTHVIIARDTHTTGRDWDG
jgi:hypothetical protein